MSDIVERLRALPPREVCEHGSQKVKCPHCQLIAADAEITRLRATLLRISCLIETDAKVDVEVIYDEIRRALE